MAAAAVAGARESEMGLNATAGRDEIPAGEAKQQLHAITAAARAVLTAALVAEPAAGAVIAVPAVAIGATAGGTGLMAVFELLGGDAAELNQ